MGFDPLSFVLGRNSVGGGENQDAEVSEALDRINGEVIGDSGKEKANYLADTKTLIGQAILSKGQELLSDDTFRSYAEKILNIPMRANKITITGGDFKAEEPIQTVEHKLGKVPDMILYFRSGVPTSGKVFFGYAFSQKALNSIDSSNGYINIVYAVVANGGAYGFKTQEGMEGSSEGENYSIYGGIRNFTDESFVIGGTSGELDVGDGNYYHYIAIDGLV